MVRVSEAAKQLESQNIMSVTFPVFPTDLENVGGVGAEGSSKFDGGGA